MQNIKYSFLFLSLLGLFSCKDIEKNPSLSCDYDYVSTEDGKCISQEYYTKDMRAKLNTSIFSNLQLSKHLSYDNYYNNYKVNTDSINQLIRPGSDIMDLYNIITNFEKIETRTNQFIDDIESDADKSYFLDKELRRLKNLTSTIRKDFKPIEDLIYVLPPQILEEDIVTYQEFLDQLRDLAVTENTFVIEYIKNYQYRGFKLQIKGNKYNIRSQIRESLENECETTMDICIVELKSETRRLFPNLYYQLLEDL